jgi:two-component system sensor histidine kinase LytS
MDEEARMSIMHPDSQTGLGIAVKNVHDRLKGFFGNDAQMLVESRIGEGTAVTLRFPGCAPLAQGCQAKDYEGCAAFQNAVRDFTENQKQPE